LTKIASSNRADGGAP